MQTALSDSTNIQMQHFMNGDQGPTSQLNFQQ